METDYIDNMPASTEMDALIAEKVMGLTITKKNLFDEPGIFVIYDIGASIACYSPKKYSSNISAAWEVVEKSVDFELSRTVWSPHGWECGIRLDKEDSTIWSKGDTASLAICRAALKAIGYKPE